MKNTKNRTNTASDKPSACVMIADKTYQIIAVENAAKDGYKRRIIVEGK